MKNKSAIQERILNQPSYWIEGVNGILYDAILTYMEKNNLNRTKLAEYLGISKGRVSQILNEGDINFSLEKIIEISLKIGKFPVFNFEDKEEYLSKKITNSKTRILSLTYNNSYSFMEVSEATEKLEPKTVSLFSENEDNQQFLLQK